MTTRSHARAARVRRAWRWGTPVVVLACGALFVVSAQNSEGTDLRPGRYVGLSGLVANEANQTRGLTGQVSALQQQIDQLSKAVPDSDVRASQRKADSLKPGAGLAEVRGQGLEITLTDAPQQKLQGSPYQPALYVVHQQDIQAVVNALWRGGASAITIQGQRVVSTTGIKCSGSTVSLQGVPYPEPFVIDAVGNPTALQAALDSDAYVATYRQQAADPQIDIGWSDQQRADIVAPAYSGLTNLQYAKPLS